MDSGAFFSGIMDNYLMMWVINIELSRLRDKHSNSRQSHSRVSMLIARNLISKFSYQKLRPASTTGNLRLSWDEKFSDFCFCLWQGEQLIKNRPWRDELLCIYNGESMIPSFNHSHTHDDVRKVFHNFFFSSLDIEKKVPANSAIFTVNCC